MQPLVPKCGDTFCSLQIFSGLDIGTRTVLSLFGEDADSQGVLVILMLWVTLQQFHCQPGELNLIRFICIHPRFTFVVVEKTALTPSFSSCCP